MTEKQLTRAELAEQIAYYRHLAEAAGHREKAFREQLTAAAQAEFAQGTAPTWRINGLGTVSATTTNDSMAVDEPALTAWVRAHHPEELVEVIRPAYLSQLVKTATLTDDGMIITPGGDEITGLKHVQGGKFKGISCRFDDTAKETFTSLAELALSRVALLSDEPAPTGPAQASADTADDPIGAFLSA